MTWHPLPSGPHVGKTVPEVFFEDPDYVLDVIETGEFNGAVLTEAFEVCRLARCIRVPRGEDEEQEVVVLYHVLPDRSFGGFVIVAKSDPKLREYERFSVASSDNCFDLSIPQRIAPLDERATKVMIQAVLFQLFGEHAQLTTEECVAFFESEENFASRSSKGGER